MVIHSFIHSLVHISNKCWVPILCLTPSWAHCQAVRIQDGFEGSQNKRWENHLATTVIWERSNNDLNQGCSNEHGGEGARRSGKGESMDLTTDYKQRGVGEITWRAWWNRLEIQWASFGAREFVFLTSCLLMLLLLVQTTHFENHWSRVSPGSGSGNGERRGTYHSPKRGLCEESGHFTNACRITCINSHIKMSREDSSSHSSFQWTSFGNTFFFLFLYLSK